MEPYEGRYPELAPLLQQKSGHTWSHMRGGTLIRLHFAAATGSKLEPIRDQASNGSNFFIQKGLELEPIRDQASNGSNYSEQRAMELEPFHYHHSFGSNLYPSGEHSVIEY